jgi:phospholipase C
MKHPIILGCMAAAFALAAGGAVAEDGDRDDHGVHTRTPIKHLVVIFQENVSFDHYFGTYPNATNPAGETKFVARPHTPAVNGLSPSLLTHNPNLLNPFRLDPSEAFTCDQDHGYADEQKAADGGRMDMFVQDTGRTGLGCKPNGSTVMGYYDGNTVTALWNYAQHFAMNDNSFDTEYGPSTPGAVNLISGQTHGGIAFTGGVEQFTGTDPVFVDRSPFGSVDDDDDAYLDDCGADAGGTSTKATTIEMSGKNVGDLLNAKGVTWGWFEGGFLPTQPATFNPDGGLKTPAVCGSSHTGHAFGNPPVTVPNPTASDGGPGEIHTPVADYSSHHQPFMYYASTRNPHHLRPASVQMIGRTDQANHQYDITDFFSALSAGNLPSVSYLKAPRFQDGHPGNSDPLTEQDFLVTVINALEQSPDWKDTAVIINYDDSDGWYDHQFSPIVNPSATLLDFQCGSPAPGAFEARCGYGPRLPFVVVSPFAKSNFVDHTQTDQTSSLRFIEENWDLGFIDGPAAPPAGQASFDRVAGSILNMFDFDHHDRDDARKLILDPTNGTVVSSSHGEDDDRH